MEIPGAIDRLLGRGILAGMLAGAVMGMYAMIASATILGQGLFTPLYGIASPLVGPGPMRASLQQGVYFALGPALVGLVIHMMWAAMYGVLFGLIARALQLRGTASTVWGVVYGIGVMLVMSFVVLPLIGAQTMPSMVGWPSFTVEHLVFGLMLGLWPAVRPQDFYVAGAPEPSH
jgi:hypothetical protein